MIANPLEDVDLEILSKKNVFTNDHIELYTRLADFLKEGSLSMDELDVDDLNQLPFQIIRKLKNVIVLKVHQRLTDEKKWIELLKLPLLENITIDRLQENAYLNLIPKYCPNLIDLIIDDFEHLDFFLQFKALFLLSCGKFFEIDLLRRSFDQANEPEEIKISINDDQYTIKISCCNVECYFNENFVLGEDRYTFRRTLYLIKDWGDLFAIS